jgi:hypothetical protein
MSDRHARVLRVVARHRQQKLDDHDAAVDLPNAKSTARRRELAWVAARTKARVAAADARRGTP